MLNNPVEMHIYIFNHNLAITTKVAFLRSLVLNQLGMSNFLLFHVCILHHIIVYKS